MKYLEKGTWLFWGDEIFIKIIISYFDLENFTIVFFLYLGSNGCSGSNGGCQQLCLPHNLGHSCLCTAGFELGADGRTCNSMWSHV